MAALAAGLATTHAQEGEEGRKRIIFPPGAREPANAPSTASPASAARPEPEAAIREFFRALAAERIEEAYEALIRGTTLADREDDVKALKERTRQALDVCGPFAKYEVLEERKAGEHLWRWTCLSLHEDLPLRWRFYFYNPGGAGWRLVDLRVDDGLVELFEDAGRRRAR